MEEFQPHYGGLHDVPALIALVVTGVGVGLLLAVAVIYAGIEHGVLDGPTAAPSATVISSN